MSIASNTTNCDGFLRFPQCFENRAGKAQYFRKTHFTWGMRAP